MKLEVFNSKFQNSVKKIDRYGRTMHNREDIDLLWKKINNSGLATFVASIKVDYCRNRQKYTDILQEITTQIPTGKTPPFATAGVSELKTGGKHNRNTSACLAEVAHLPNGTLYTGSYPYKAVGEFSSYHTPRQDLCKPVRGTRRTDIKQLQER